MPDEASRHRLFEEMKEATSVESAEELFHYLPPVGWADVATKADLGMIRNEMDAQRAELRGEMAELRGELRSGMSELRGEMAELRGELRSEMAGLRGELHSEMAELRGELHSEMAGQRGEMRTSIAEAKDSLRVWTVATQLTMFFGLVGVILTVGRLHG